MIGSLAVEPFEGYNEAPEGVGLVKNSIVKRDFYDLYGISGRLGFEIF